MAATDAAARAAHPNTHTHTPKHTHTHTHTHPHTPTHPPRHTKQKKSVGCVPLMSLGKKVRCQKSPRSKPSPDAFRQRSGPDRLLRRVHLGPRPLPSPRTGRLASPGSRRQLLPGIVYEASNLRERQENTGVGLPCAGRFSSWLCAWSWSGAVVGYSRLPSATIWSLSLSFYGRASGKDLTLKGRLDVRGTLWENLPLEDLVRQNPGGHACRCFQRLLFEDLSTKPPRRGAAWSSTGSVPRVGIFCSSEVMTFGGEESSRSRGTAIVRMPRARGSRTRAPRGRALACR